MVKATFANTWEESNTTRFQEMDQIDLMDCIPRDEELGDFLTEVGPLANADDSEFGILGADFMMVDMLPKNFMSTQKEDERATTPPPLLHTNGCDSSADMFLSPSASTASDLQDLENQYKKAIEQLRVSMKRSQETRQQIIQNQLIMQTSAPVAKLFSDSTEFFAGSRSTLTASLEQSRSMLMSYTHQMETL
jgi:hypothetical protein